MMTPDECKQRLKELRKMLAEASDSMKLEALRKELAEKTALSEREEVWSDLKRLAAARAGDRFHHRQDDGL